MCIADGSPSWGVWVNLRTCLDDRSQARRLDNNNSSRATTTQQHPGCEQSGDTIFSFTPDTRSSMSRVSQSFVTCSLQILINACFVTNDEGNKIQGIEFVIRIRWCDNSVNEEKFRRLSDNNKLQISFYRTFRGPSGYEAPPNLYWQPYNIKRIISTVSYSHQE